MKKLRITILLLLLLLFSLIATTTRTTVPTITYFPPDDSVYYTDVTNELFLTNNILNWRLSSTTNKQTYLRQDVALLFLNGYFKGVMNAWETNGQTIMLKEQLTPSTGLYTSISYHYAETQSEGHIRSKAVMGYSSVLINCDKEPCEASKEEENKSPKMLAHVQSHWTDLLNYFNINEENFTQLALTDIITFNDHPLPSFTQEKTDDIINHLWEGLYANYFVEIMSTPEGKRKHIMPLILYNEHELYILYELNGKKEQLIQRISM